MRQRFGRGPSSRTILWASLLAVALLTLAGTGAAAEALQVEALLPQGRVERLSQVAVRFSQAMRPLGEMEQAAGTSPMSLSPRPAGSFRWLDPQTLAYILDQPISGPTRLEVKITAGTRALSGVALPRDYLGRVETPPLTISEASPSPGRDLGIKAQVQVTLSRQVHLSTLNERAYLLVQGRRMALKAEEVPIEPWLMEPALARVYRFSSEENLPANQRATFVIEPGLRPLEGDLPSQESFQAVYHTYSPLRLLKWEMARNNQGQLNPDAMLHLEFNNPVAPKEVMSRLKLTPPSPQARALDEEEPSRWVRLALKLTPRSECKLEIAPGLRDSYGTALAQPVTIALKTGDRDPVFQLVGDKGVQEVGGAPHYPLRLRNMGTIRATARMVGLEQAVPLVAAEEERPYERKPKAPLPGTPGVTTRELTLDLPPNQLVEHPLNLEQLLGGSPRGGVLLLDLRADMAKAKGKREEVTQRAVVQVTDLGLSLKLGQSGGLAWATRLSSGLPLEGVELQLRDRLNKVLWQGRSDAQGLAYLPSLAQLKPAPRANWTWKGPKVYLLARQGQDVAVLSQDWSDDLGYSLPHTIQVEPPEKGAEVLAHAITQLPLYQPGQTVRLLVYLRGQDARGLIAPPAAEARVEVEDPGGRVAHAFTATPNAYGSLAGSFPLTAGARLGEYTIKVKQGGASLSAGQFRVASFRPPDFKVGVEAPGDVLGGGQPLAAQVQAQYLFGAPVAGGRAKVNVEQRPANFAPARLEGWAVGDLPPNDDEPNPLVKSLGAVEAELDDQGRGGLTVPAPSPLPGAPVRLQLEATVADASGLTVGGGRSVLAHPAAVYLGLKAPTLARAGQAARVQMLAATHDNQPAPSLTVTLTAFSEVWETVRERGPGGFYRHLSKPRREQVWQGRTVLGPQEAALDFTPPQSGAYVLVAEAADQAGRLNRSATYVYAAGSGLAAWQRFDDNSLELALERNNLEPGQTARLLIKNPFAKATALISVERLGVSRVQVTEVSGPAPVIEVPIEAADAPNAYLGVLLVRGRAGPPPPDGPDLARPQVKVGYVNLKVKDPQAGLKVSLQPDRAEARPGQEISARVAVSDQQGQPRRCQVTLLAVDERVMLAAGEGDNHDPRQTFLKARPLNVISADLRTQVIGRRFAGEKGEEEAGGGGFGPPMRTEFHPAVFWLAQAETDEQGHLAASFRLPDSLTAYRLVAVAADPGQNFGLGKATVRARQPLQMLSALPRFATRGDAFSARVLVQNLGDKPGTVKVTAQATGLKLEGPSVQEVELSPGQSKPVGFTVSAPVEGSADLSLRASLGGHEDAARFSLEVLPATQLLTAAAFGDLDPGAGRSQAQVPLLLPAGSQPGRGGLSLSLAPSLAAVLQAPAALLTEYPWDCLEQRFSRAAALAARLLHGEALGLKPQPEDRARLRRILDSAADFQTSEGGFTFWPGMGRADLYLTAYVVLANGYIGKSGERLEQSVLVKALDFMEARLKRGQAPKPEQVDRRSAEAAALWALAWAGRDARPLLEATLTRLQGLDPFGLAAVMLAGQALGNERAVEMALERLESTATLSAGHLHFATVDPGRLKAVLGSQLRGNALALNALVWARPAYPRLEALAAWVAMRLGQEPGLSTQEAVFGLWGVTAFLDKTPMAGGLTLEARLAGQSLLQRQFEQPGQPPALLDLPASRLTPGQAQVLEISAQGQGRPLYSARLTHAPEQPAAQPVNAGLALTRLLKPRGAGVLKVGDLVDCQLTLLVPETRHHVLLTDPYPAGLEPVAQVPGRPQAERDDDDEEAGFNPWRWKEARRSKMLLYAPRLQPGVYSFRHTLRVVAPGRFVQAPARAEEMYSPEVFGSTAAGVVEVK